MYDHKNIIQLATPRAIGAIHIIRLSGNGCLPFLKKHVKLKKIIPKKVYFASFLNKKKTIDKLVFFYSLKPNSFTGEDMVELQVHGSLLIVEEILKIALQEKFVLAQPGEFSERAFLNGKISIEMAEAMNSLITTKSSYLKENALKILEKKSSLNFFQLEKTIQKIISELEVSIEFPEEDIPELEKPRQELYAHYNNKIEKLIGYFKQLAKNFTTGKKISEGIKVSILGLPNVGKSTLFNSLLKEDRSIISRQAGTTRDFINEEFQLENFSLTLIDTAGIRETNEKIEKVGVKKTFQIIAQSDIIIFLITDLLAIKKLLSLSFQQKYNLGKKPLLIYINKVDILKKKKTKKIRKTITELNLTINGEISLKEKKNQSVKQVLKDIKNILEKKFKIPKNELSLISYRQFVIVERLLTKFKIIKKMIAQFSEEEILVEEFRKLKNDLAELNLNIEKEEIFNTLFRQFCIGK